MKNTLAENLLRFGVKNLSEADIKKIFEQTTTPTNPGQQQQAGPPTLTGASSKYLQQIPNFDKFTKLENDNWSFSPVLFQQYMLEYLGGQRSGGAEIIGKNIFFFKNSIANLSKPETEMRGTDTGVTKYVPKTDTKYIEFDKGNTDTWIVGTFIPKAWYYGKNVRTNMPTLYLFNREITTNYSGNPNKPFITTTGTAAWQAAEGVYTYGDLNVPEAGESQTPYVDDVKLVSQTLMPSNKLKKGVDYITIEFSNTEGFCPQFKGYADYLIYLGFGKNVNSIGINSAGVTQTKQVTTK